MPAKNAEATISRNGADTFTRRDDDGSYVTCKMEWGIGVATFDSSLCTSAVSPTIVLDVSRFTIFVGLLDQAAIS